MRKYTQAGRRMVALALALLLGLALAACGQNVEAAPADADAWMEQASFAAQESPEELYQKALEEGGSLLVYTTTTRAMDTKNSFEKQYPGLVVEMRDMRSSYLVETILQEQAEGQVQCDVVLCSDNSAAISGTLEDVVCKYTPWDMTDKLLYTNEVNHLHFMTEAQVFCYNGEAWDTPPFDNVWQLCEERFYGKVYVPNPLSSYSTYSLFETMLRQDEAMREAYRQLYGEELDLPADENAGEEFLRRLIKNGLVVTNSSDEVAEAVGAPGQRSEAVGSIISSKLRMNSVGYTLRPQYQLAPFAGVSSRNSVMVTVGTPRASTAKLFVRWLLGEADGGGDGYAPFMQKGTWSVRSDVADGDDTPFEDIPLLDPDKTHLYQDLEPFEAFWVDALERYQTGGAG